MLTITVIIACPRCSLVPALVAQIENNTGSVKDYQARVTEHLIPAISQLAINVGDDVRPPPNPPRFAFVLSSSWALADIAHPYISCATTTEIVEDPQPPGVAHHEEQRRSGPLCRSQGGGGLLPAPRRRVPSPPARGTCVFACVCCVALRNTDDSPLFASSRTQTVPFLAELMEDSAMEVEQLSQEVIALINKYLPEGESIASYFQ